MKTLFLSVASAALILAAPTAFAAGDDNDQTKHHEHTQSQGQSNTSDTSNHSGGDKTRTWTENGHVKTTASPGSVVTDSRTRDDKDHHDDNNHRDTDNHRGTSGDWRNDHHGSANDWRSNNSRTNVNVRINFNRRNVTAEHHYRWRGRAWNWPSGYRYQRWSFGMTLPSVFWVQDYWISDYSDYGLAYPPNGAVWVRYGNDAILIDRYNGEILEVVYNQFD